MGKSVHLGDWLISAFPFSRPLWRPKIAGNAYDESIRSKAAQGKSGEQLFFELALEDLTQAADLFRPVFDSTKGVDGWVSVEARY